MIFHALLATMISFAEPREELLNLLGGEWVSQGIYAAARLDIATHLQKGPKSASELASLAQVDEKALYRVLSMLASRGVFEERENRVFANTSVSERLASKHPETLKSLALFYGEEIRLSFQELLSSVKTGRPAFNEVFQEPVFEYFKTHPERAALFQSAMAEKTKAVTQSVIEKIRFEGTLCDVGGGKGHLLHEILKANTALQGIHFDLPEVVASLPEPPSRVKLEGGSFFDSIPKADSYLLKSILHDWQDKEALEILKTFHKSMPDHGRIYVIELVMQSVTGDYAKLVDVLMLVVTGGCERTLTEYQELFEKSGFELKRVFNTGTEFRILEVGKKLL